MYPDDIISFIALLQYIDDIGDDTKLKISNEENHPEYFNSLLVQKLDDHFKSMGRREKIEFLGEDDLEEQDFAEELLDEEMELLPINEGQNYYFVLAIGVTREGKPFLVIYSGEEVMNYIIPKEYLEWAYHVLAFISGGVRLFPGEVVFSFIDGQYYVEIL